MKRFTMISAAALALVLGGCADSTGPVPAPGQGRVSLSVGSTTATSGNTQALASDTMTLGGTTLVIERVQLVISEIELRRAQDTTVCDSSASGDDGCEELEIGPMLLDLPLGSGPAHVFTVDIDTGTYRRIGFEIHKPDDDTPGDSAFLQQNPGFRGVSIRVEGSWNGTPFVFTSDLNEDQRLDLNPPLVVSEAGATNLVLMLDLRQWFLDASRTSFVDPATANKGGANENLVRDNIRDSIEAFEQR
jgi:hypothetical protein